jgi:hypothetical protein
MKKTAVEWLLEQLPTIDKYDSYYVNIINQAKEMEKQQIIDAYDKGEFNQGCNGDAEQYYNETFNKKA